MVGEDRAAFLAMCRAAAEAARPSDARALSALPLDERARLVREAVERVGATFAPCREYLFALADGADIDSLARRARVAPDVLCRQVTRCRERVRDALARDGYVL